MFAALPVMNPGLLALIERYVPAGMFRNEYTPEPFVVVVRAPKSIVAPLIGAPPGLTVTVPVSVPPAPTGVHDGYWNDPILVFQRMLAACDTGLAYSFVIQNVQPFGSNITEL